jgi:AraC-like DNA-binding protein
MIYKEVDIKDKLPPINRIWTLKNSQNSTRKKLEFLPNGAFDICYITGEGIEICFDKSDKLKISDGLYFLGQTTNKIEIDLMANTEILIFEFAPWIPCQLFNYNFSLLTNRIIELKFLSQKIYDDFEDITKFNEVEIIKEFHEIVNYYISNNSASKLIKDVYNIILESSKNDINFVTQKVGCSTRYIQMIFKENVGLTPKKFQKIIELRREFEKIYDTKVSLTHLSYDMGYYDQSHFIKGFKQIYDSSPLNLNISKIVFPLKNIQSSFFYNF